MVKCCFWGGGGGNLFSLPILRHGRDNLRVPSPSWALNSIKSGLWWKVGLIRYFWAALYCHNFSPISRIDRRDPWSNNHVDVLISFLLGFVSNLGFPNSNNWSFEDEVLLKSAWIQFGYWREVILPRHDDIVVLTCFILKNSVSKKKYNVSYNYSMEIP